MTQRTWTTEDGWRVLTGWDRPLQHFFLDISRPCADCQGEGIKLDAPDNVGIESGDVAPEFECQACKGMGEQRLFSNLNSPKYNRPQHDRQFMPGAGMTRLEVLSELHSYLTAIPDEIPFILDADRQDNRGNDTYNFPIPIGRVKKSVI